VLHESFAQIYILRFTFYTYVKHYAIHYRVLLAAVHC